MTKCQSFGAGILFVVMCVDGFLKRPTKISRFFCDDEQKGIILMNKRKYYDQTISRPCRNRA